MAAIVKPAPVGGHIAIPAWTWAVTAVGLFLAYVMLQENGLLMNSWMTVHEFFHDGRHAFGFPCH
jgi:hypothetical protein